MVSFADDANILVTGISKIPPDIIMETQQS